MKKILLSIAFIGAVLLGRAQVVFNEFYPNPGSGKDEYLELYNTGSTDINLNCWSILAYDQTNHQAYVYQLPNVTIPGFGWWVFTGSTASPLTIKYSQPAVTYSGSNISSWNLTNGTDSSLRLFKKSGSTLIPGSDTTTTDFLLDPSGGNGIALFLFNGGVLKNAFIGSGSPAIPADFASLTSPINLSLDPACTPIPVTLSAITATQAELQAVVSATGNDNGYYRTTNGLCGTWNKGSATKEQSPGTSNGGTGSTSFANVTASSNCNQANGQVTWNGSITITNGIFNPSTYAIYEDINGDHLIETGTDLLKTSGTITDLVAHNYGPFTLGFHHDLLVQVTAQQNCLIFFRAFQVACISLPVSFKTFTATRNNSNVLLKWETAWEQNSNGFVIERNINGIWQEVTFVPSQAAGGNSTSALAYLYVDLNNVKGISQYRVRQVDFDNKFKYSDIRAVRGDGQTGNTIVFPNPSLDGRVSIVFEDASVTRDASLSDMAGRILKQWKGVTNNNIQIDNLTPGMYSLRIVVPETGAQSVQKIIVSKR